MDESTATIPTRFTPALDIVLLKEIIATNPFCNDKNAKEWEVIVGNVNSNLPNGRRVTIRSCKDRLKTLNRAHQKAEMNSLKASGTDEEYTERDALLTEVAELMGEAARVKDEKKGIRDSERQKEEQGREIRQAAMLTLKRSGESEDDQVAKSRKKSSSRSKIAEYLEVLKDKFNKESELRTEQLRLDREKFELEKKEREQRMERDNVTLELLKSLGRNRRNHEHLMLLFLFI